MYIYRPHTRAHFDARNEIEMAFAKVFQEL